MGEWKNINEEQENIICDIKSFFHEHIADKLVDEVPNVVMDVTRPTKDHVKLIDFNPFGETTDTKLFNWSELHEMQVDEDEENEIDFRFVETESGIQPNGLRHYSLPQDIVDMACGTDHEKLVDFLKLQSDLQNKENTS